MNGHELERYYETAILPLYKDVVDVKSITWKDHGKVGHDAWAHYFDDENGREYVLLYEDFPGGEFLDDGLSHEVVPCRGETTVHVATTPETQVENVMGYFTLYVEKRRPGAAVS